MDSKEIFNLFLILSALHGFLFCIIILFSKNGKEKSMIFINLLVLSISLNNFQSWVLAKDLFPDYIFINYIHIPWHFLIAPFFYTFLIHYLQISKKSFPVLKYVFSIFLIIVITRICFVYNYRNEISKDITYLFEKYTTIEEIISLLFSLIIYGYSFFIIKERQLKFKEVLSFDNLKWIYTFFKLGAVTYIFWIIALLFTIALNFTDFLYVYYPLRVLTTIIIYWVGYQALIQLKLLNERKDLRKALVQNKNIKQQKTTNSANISIVKEEEFKLICSSIKDQNKFIDPTLSLEQLANDFDMSNSKLSSLINTYAQKNFKDFINELRVEFAKQLLIDTDYQNYTITAIGLESGFNSKSTFYTAFKKFAGKTPSEYKKR